MGDLRRPEYRDYARAFLEGEDCGCFVIGLIGMASRYVRRQERAGNYGFLFYKKGGFRMTLKTMQADIEHLVSQYVKSIDEANSDLAATIWSMTEDVSFIHPISIQEATNTVGNR